MKRLVVGSLLAGALLLPVGAAQAAWCGFDCAKGNSKAQVVKPVSYGKRSSSFMKTSFVKSRAKARSSSILSLRGVKVGNRLVFKLDNRNYFALIPFGNLARQIVASLNSPAFKLKVNAIQPPKVLPPKVVSPPSSNGGGIGVGDGPVGGGGDGLAGGGGDLATPLPAAAPLFLSGLLGMGYFVRRRKKTAV